VSARGSSETGNTSPVAQAAQARDGAAGAGDAPVDPDARVGALRGAGVDVDTKVAVRVLVAVCMVTLAVLVVILTVAGINKNAQITSLKEHGVPVQVTVSGCLGQVAGSGTNIAGYSCHGTFTLQGQRHTDDLPGTDFHAPGAQLEEITVPSDPGLLSTPAAAATEQASWHVFIVPAVLLVVLLALVALIGIRRRRRSDHQPPSAPA